MVHRPRAYISGPLQAAPDLVAARRFYETLAEICSDAGLEAYLPHQRTDPELHTSASPLDVYRSDRLAIRKCDLLIAHVGLPSSGVGAEVGLAVSSGQPILALYRRTERPSRFLLGMLQEYETAHVILFGDEHDLRTAMEQALKEFLERPQQAIIRAP